MDLHGTSATQRNKKDQGSTTAARDELQAKARNSFHRDQAFPVPQIQCLTSPYLVYTETFHESNECSSENKGEHEAN